MTIQEMEISVGILLHYLPSKTMYIRSEIDLRIRTIIKNNMKTLVFSLLVTLFAVGAHAQDPIYVYVDTEVQNGETLRTFYVEGNYCQMLINHWSSEYGTPNGAGSGDLKWSNVDMPGIGTGLSIHANDGAQIFDGNNWSHSTFLNAADMETKLGADPARSRRMYITVKKGNKNKVTTQAAEDIFVDKAEEIMLAE